MTAGAIFAQAEAFWEEVGFRPPCPRDLTEPVAWALPLAVTVLPRLWVRTAEEWLARQRIPAMLAGEDRPLFGCLVASGGEGIAMVDGTASTADRRFTLAHEVAHFICDYYQPRQRAVEQIGPGVKAVLDGLRPPTISERASAALAGMQLGMHVHLMERGAGGMLGCEAILGAETRADQLALELLAPAAEVEQQMRAAGLPSTHRDRVRLAEGLLMRNFGLPPTVAAGYAPPLCRSAFGGRSFREWLAG